MRVRALLLLLLLAAPVLAQGEGSVPFAQGTAVHFVAAEGTCGPPGGAAIAPGAVATLCVRWQPGGNASGPANLTLRLDSRTGWAVPAGNFTAVVNLTGPAVVALRAGVPVPANATAGGHTLTGNLTLEAGGATQTRVLAWSVPVAAAPPPPGGPNWILFAALAALLAVGVGGTVAVLRRRQVRAAPRSAAMRQAEVERRIEKAKAPEEQAAIRAEVAAQEEQRSLGREASILEAKIADVRKGLARLQERREAGQLTAHQFDQMRIKREAQLEELQGELDRLRGA